MLLLRTKNKKTGQGGFTLIELLMAISIMGFIASIFISAVSTSKKNARDVRRLDDMRVLSQALQIYAGDTGNYPTVTIDDGGGARIDLTAVPPFLPQLSGSYVDKTVVPPTGGSNFNYMYIVTSPNNTNCIGGGGSPGDYTNGQFIGSACGYSDTTSFCRTNAKAALFFSLEKGYSSSYPQSSLLGMNAVCFY
jgi:prepilin-type N-terminal cleavage/methylation domain-containing protein